jgi:prepilin-type N-terminal cleavage/methylation domain-containing protein
MIRSGLSQSSFGFGLMELLICLVVLAVVAALIVPSFIGVRERASQVTYEATVAELESAYNKWTSLGGVLQPGSETENASAFIRLIMSDPVEGRARVVAGAASCTDSSGPAGSWMISLDNASQNSGLSNIAAGVVNISFYLSPDGKITILKLNKNSGSFSAL